MNEHGKIPRWFFDERVPTGVDYREEQRVQEYDARHGRFRDFEAEAEGVLGELALTEGATIVDMGAGTGAFAIPAARRGFRVRAVDVSPAMRARLTRKARASGVRDLIVQEGGFLTYELDGHPVDAVVSSVALHHLPDLWKQIALLRLADIVRPGGRLYLVDVALGTMDWPPLPAMAAWVEEIGRALGSAEEAETHLRDEFSTFEWIVSGMIERAGFRVDDVASPRPLMTRWLATKL